jgi:hypothetical protein
VSDDRDEGDGACAGPGRLEALRGYEILDTPREPEFDSLAELASRVCRTPIAAVNLIEDRRQWFKAEVGIGVREMPVEDSICRHFLLRPGLNIVNDTRADPRLSGNPLVAGEPGLRFYAGCLLQTPEGTPSARCACWTIGRATSTRTNGSRCGPSRPRSWRR